MDQLVNIKTLFSFLMALTLSRGAHALEKPNSVQCPDVQGLRYKPEYKEGINTINKITSNELYTDSSETNYLSHILISESKFINGNVDILVEILNSKNEAINNFVLNHWTVDLNVPNMRLNRVNLYYFIKSHLVQPYDRYMEEQNNIKPTEFPSNIPYNAKITIKDAFGKSFCDFNFNYGTLK